MPRLPEIDVTLRTVERIASTPTAPYHEQRVMRAIAAELESLDIRAETDQYGQVHARLQRGRPARPMALLAHTDHPAFDVVRANGSEGRARVLGGFYERMLRREFPVLVCDDTDAEPFSAVLDDYEQAPDLAHNSLGSCRIRAQRPLRLGQWAVVDLPGFELRADELHLRAADDLALVAVVLLTLRVLKEDPRPHDVHAVFTRAEETGLYGARLLAEDGLIQREAVVVSLEASRALATAVPGHGPVIRPGDVYNTFSNDGERYLRVARERLADARIPTQRALLTGGTCESSAFVRMGWTTTAIALPNVNYHNMSEEHDRFVPEVVRLSDLRAAVALLVEGAAAAGADDDESWWPDVRTVAPDIRALMRRSN